MATNEEGQHSLIEKLERPGFLSSPTVGAYDYEVRIDIINRLGEIGTEAAIPVLQSHARAYGRSPDPTENLVARAAEAAIKLIEMRLKMRKKKEEEDIEKARKEHREIMSKKKPVIEVGEPYGGYKCNLDEEAECMLVVDDNAADLEYLVKLIKDNFSTRILEAMDMETALKITSKYRIVMLITDIVMPMYEMGTVAYTEWEQQSTTRHELLMHGITLESIPRTRTRIVPTETQDYTKFAGFRLLDEVRNRIPWLPVIIVSKYADLRMAQQAIGEKVQGIFSKDQLQEDAHEFIKCVRDNFVPTHERLASLGYERVLDLIRGASERDLIKNYIIPLLNKLGFRGIRYTHGPSECGLDIVCFEIDRLGKRRYVGAQVKAGKIHKNEEKKPGRNIVTILNQIQQAFESTIFMATEKKELDIDRIIVISSQSISRDAREYIRRSLQGKVYSQHIDFLDGDELADLLASTR
jgi:DNA-binding NarL/FixJ family response regulator